MGRGEQVWSAGSGCYFAQMLKMLKMLKMTMRVWCWRGDEFSAQAETTAIIAEENALLVLEMRMRMMDSVLDRLHQW
jgi:hypothetical protein